MLSFTAPTVISTSFARKDLLASGDLSLYSTPSHKPCVQTLRKHRSSRPNNFVCKSTSEITAPISTPPHVAIAPLKNDQKSQIQPRSILEVWADMKIQFAQVVSLHNRTITIHFLQSSNTVPVVERSVEISYDAVVAIWPASLVPLSGPMPFKPAKAISHGIQILKKIHQPSLHVNRVYDMMRKFPNPSQSAFTSYEIAQIIFPPSPNDTIQCRASFTVAACLLISADTTRFKRAPPGHGWCPLPPSISTQRDTGSFIHTCTAILDTKTSSMRSTPPDDSFHHPQMNPVIWTQDELDILHDLEIVAAGGSVSCGNAATTLQQLGYAPNDDGAAAFLLDINYWATGPTTSSTLTTNSRKMNVLPVIKLSDNQTSIDSTISLRDNQRSSAQRDKMQETFLPEILAQARDVRIKIWERRRRYLTEKSTSEKRRRNFVHPEKHQSTLLRAYCIDEKSSRFLDDAISVQVLEEGSVIRLWLHIADVDETIKAGSALDNLARERGQSLYLRLQPFHMLPAAAMDAASFNTSLPTEAITVMVDFDLSKNSARNWRVFPSIVPPVRRITYKQFDVALEQGAKVAQLSAGELADLRAISLVAQLLSDRASTHRSGQKFQSTRKYNERNNGSVYSNVIAEGADVDQNIDFIQVARRNGNIPNMSVRMAKRVNSRPPESHQTVNYILTYAADLFRQFARENKAYLPEERHAYLYSIRCGTAPLRRYIDLAVQRQIKRVLYGKRPAGKRQMDELKDWLLERHAAADRTMAKQRQTALYDSFSTYCAQKCAVVGFGNPIIRGVVRNVFITKTSNLRVAVSFFGTISTTATVSNTVLSAIYRACNIEITSHVNGEALLAAAKKLLKSGSQVRVEILEINTGSCLTRSCVVDLI